MHVSRHPRLGVLLLVILLTAFASATPVRAGTAAPAAAMNLPVGTGDTLHITVRELVNPGQDYSAEVQVNENGDIRVQKLGMVRVSGLTPAEIETKIAQAAIAGRFLFPKGPGNPGPQVSVKLLSKAADNPAAFCMIGLGDRLSIRVPELVTPGTDYVIETRVNELGVIKLQNLGRLHVGDLTATQVEDKIIQLAVDRRFLLPKGNGNPGPAAFVRILEKANPPVLGGVLPKIASADTLDIQVVELVDPGRTYTIQPQVDAQGEIRLRNLGRLHVAGLTTDEVEDKIARQAVADGLLIPKSDTHPGPQVIVAHIKQAAPGERPATFRPGDTLQIDAFDLIEPAKPYLANTTVGPSGDITLPNLGTFPVAGLTPYQFADQIIDRAIAAGQFPKNAADRLRRQIAITKVAPAATTTPATAP
jgi:protein involved in polysaccharide export with SLBB domain